METARHCIGVATFELRAARDIWKMTIAKWANARARPFAVISSYTCIHLSTERLWCTVPLEGYGAYSALQRKYRTKLVSLIPLTLRSKRIETIG